MGRAVRSLRERFSRLNLASPRAPRCPSLSAAASGVANALNPSRVGALAALALLLAAGAATAQPAFVSNIGQTSSGTPSFTFDHAQAFTAGNHADGYVLTKVNIVMVRQGTPPVLRVSVVSPDASGNPGGTAIGTLMAPSEVSTGVNEFVASGGGLDLAANGTYYVVAEVTGDAANRPAVLIRTTNSDAEDSDPASGWSIADDRRSRDPATNAWGTPTAGDSLKIAIHGTPVKAGPPALSSASVVRDALTLTFDEVLDPGSTPAGSAFSVSATPSGGTARTIAGTGTVTIAGATVTVTLAEAVAEGEAVTVSYTKPASDPLQDLGGTAVATFAGESVTNETNSFLVSNIGQANTGTAPFSSAFLSYYHAITVGPTTIVLDGVDARFNVAPDPDPDEGLEVRIEVDANRHVIATLENPSDLTSGVNTFTAPAGTVLRANETYRVLFRRTTTGTFDLVGAGLTDPGPESGWSMASKSRRWVTASSVFADVDGAIPIGVRGRPAWSSAERTLVANTDGGSFVHAGFRGERDGPAPVPNPHGLPNRNCGYGDFAQSFTTGAQTARATHLTHYYFNTRQYTPRRLRYNIELRANRKATAPSGNADCDGTGCNVPGQRLGSLRRNFFPDWPGVDFSSPVTLYPNTRYWIVFDYIDGGTLSEREGARGVHAQTWNEENADSLTGWTIADNHTRRWQCAGNVANTGACTRSQSDSGALSFAGTEWEWMKRPNNCEGLPTRPGEVPAHPTGIGGGTYQPYEVEFELRGHCIGCPEDEPADSDDSGGDGGDDGSGDGGDDGGGDGGDDGGGGGSPGGGGGGSPGGGGGGGSPGGGGGGGSPGGGGGGVAPPSNSAPETAQEPEDRTVRMAAAVEIDLSGAFEDPDEDALEYTANSSDPAVATAAVEGDTLTVRGVGRGMAEITVTATDPDGATASQTFAVTVTAPETVWYLPAMVDPQRQGFVRVINHSDTTGEATVTATDDAGVAYEPLTLALGPRQARHFNSEDLELGNADKGLTGATGPGEGGWRLAIESEALDIEALGYVRAADGFLTAMNAVAPREDGALQVAIFNPGSNVDQASQLRLVNLSDEDAEATVTGVDDAGASPGAPVLLELSAGSACTLDAAQLESGAGLACGSPQEGLGDGTGKWRLAVDSEAPLVAMSLLSSPAGHLTNLSGMAAADDEGVWDIDLFPSASDPLGRQGFVRVTNRSTADGSVTVSAYDDSDTVYETLRLRVGAGASAHFNSDDLELGNRAKGLTGSTGSGTGPWRLRMSSGLDIDVNAYMRARDGFLTAVQARAPGDGAAHRVAMLNPGSNTSQVGVLRLVNRSSREAEASIDGTDDLGLRPGSTVSVRVPATDAVELTAAELESGEHRAISSGALGDGAGKWRLRVQSNRVGAVLSLLSSPGGHLTNLSGADPERDFGPLPTALLPAPETVTLESPDLRELRATWSAVEGARYDVELMRDGVVDEDRSLSNARNTTTSFHWTHLLPGAYVVRARSVNEDRVAGPWRTSEEVEID